MSCNMNIDINGLTAQEIHKKVYNDLDDYVYLYEEILGCHPELKSNINKAWIQSSISSIAFEEFKNSIFESTSSDDITFYDY